MSISYPHSLPPLSMKLESDLPDQPLDLSFNSLVIQKFKDQISVQQISKELGLSTDRIYSIISKTSLVKIKDFTRYTSDIKDRVKEARIAGKTLSEIAKIFNLKPHQVIYINRCNRATLIKHLCSVHLIPNGNPSPMTMEELKALLRYQRIQQLTRKT